MTHYRKLTQYQKAALKAATLAANNTSPAEAWDIAAHEFCGTPSSAEKPCPKSTFLGLAGAGLIKGISPGQYTTSNKNAIYAKEGLALLHIDETLAMRPMELWRRVMNGKATDYNQQMHVVTALWREKKFVDQPA
ncbi:DUF6979 family protein [Noviherbaspirillum autotrophicum]|uniref:DUF6979 family protein n=1 Tax=Noviherbaspirillum autotrophicum TaxID=709839 RepID=UPI000693D09A|nr:hypothetical protein [Noviherbaspirillum autotrophicum]